MDPGVADGLARSLLPHAVKAFESPAPAPAWAEEAFAHNLAFLRCTQDAALPTFVQDMFLQRSGVEWVVKDIQSSHSPYASRPQEVTDTLVGWAIVFGKIYPENAAGRS